MQYLNTHPDTRLQGGLRLTRIRYLLLIPLLLLAAFELSILQLTLLTLVCALGFSFVERVNGLTKAKPRFNPGTGKLKAFDGGSFSAGENPPPTQGSRQVIYDGGSFERAHLG